MIKEPLEEIVAKLAAVDGFSIRGITKSEFIRSILYVVVVINFLKMNLML